MSQICNYMSVYVQETDRQAQSIEVDSQVDVSPVEEKTS